ncbi:hypothetical protein [Mycobacterium sp. shizuoka-1]|uniref:hypothetical protein n=1 Tax=Mycobacterium sp. shizuoka-1 TaxID=2039281 RepID=UPI000C063EBE|nr:hypothetical protein [Mycobacterium sp. shizuoka-1]GAY15875.1 hypothetical protein MSZK_26010 [Mycobacterium sp. shizuoka-1]
MSETTTESDTVTSAVIVDELDEELMPGETTGNDEQESQTTIVLRQILERQIAVNQALGGQLIDAATDVTTAVAHAPATFAGAIRNGETIAAAWERTGAGVHDVLGEAGGRLRAAVTSYVGHQATLPVAVLGYAGEVAASLASAQGTVAGSALDGAFAVASAATAGDDVRAGLGHQLDEVRATAAAARGDVNASAKRAGQEVKEAIGGEPDTLIAAITGVGEDS